MRYSERVPFRLLIMPCCNYNVCWVNSRLPSYCPECGKFVFAEIKGAVSVYDPNATLKVDPNAHT